MAENENEQKAAMVGQDKPAKDVTQVYDAGHGMYGGPYAYPSETARDLKQSKSTVTPFGALKKGK